MSFLSDDPQSWKELDVQQFEKQQVETQDFLLSFEILGEAITHVSKWDTAVRLLLGRIILILLVLLLYLGL